MNSNKFTKDELIKLGNIAIKQDASYKDLDIQCEDARVENNPFYGDDTIISYGPKHQHRFVFDLSNHDTLIIPVSSMKKMIQEN